ncbi:MAG: D-tyrosyl-tRNA(Tyr) deacylase [Nitrospirae bacterium]|nr:D-tyrosyl-tRNA(Tyr) deacylase [Nitrospirota bacterium]
MKALLQRVSEARVETGGRISGEIRRGLLVLLCVVRGDTRKDLDYIIKKVLALRVFDDSRGRMNLSVADAGGEILVVPQFTLAARTRRGNRPSFDDAESPQKAKQMFDSLVQGLRDAGIRTETGSFGEHMRVFLVNDGPVTLMIDSREGGAG